MGRIRTIKPSFFQNEDLADLPGLTRLLFQGLWTEADREGRLEDRPRKLKAAILPYDQVNVDSCLDQLQNKGFIIRYAVEGQRYIQVVNFVKHQRPHHKEPPSTIPSPPQNHTQAMLEPSMNQARPKQIASCSMEMEMEMGMGKGMEMEMEKGQTVVIDENSGPNDDFAGDLPPPSPLIESVAEVLAVDLERCSSSRRTTVERCAEALRETEPTLDENTLAAHALSFGVWFAGKGLRDPTPSASQVIDDWPRWKRQQARASPQNGQQLTGDHIPELRAYLRERRDGKTTKRD